MLKRLVLAVAMVLALGLSGYYTYSAPPTDGPRCCGLDPF
jgi:hypothetical protein